MPSKPPPYLVGPEPGSLDIELIPQGVGGTIKMSPPLMSLPKLPLSFGPFSGDVWLASTPEIVQDHLLRVRMSFRVVLAVESLTLKDILDPFLGEGVSGG